MNIHRFLARLVDQLERDGVAFHWGVEVTALHRDATGRVEGVYTEGGELDAANVVISPGVYGAELLRGTATEGIVQGMLGVWLSVPNVEPMLDHSLKIARKGHRAEETNATLSAGPEGEPLVPAVEDRAIEVQSLLADRGLHRAGRWWAARARCRSTAAERSASSSHQSPGLSERGEHVVLPQAALGVSVVQRRCGQRGPDLLKIV